MPTAHHRKDCPGRCGRWIVHRMVACGPCMAALPEQIRAAVEANLANAYARRDALAWYRQRNAEAAMGGNRGETL